MVGYEQGGLIAACLSMPLVVEVACRTRIVTGPEMISFRQALARLASIAVYNPVITSTRYISEELLNAIPELGYLQPRLFPRFVVLSGTMPAKAAFGEELAEIISAPSFLEKEFPHHSRVKSDLATALSQIPPVYIEDDASGLGHCIVCNKRGVLGRCPACGLLMHYSCLSPLHPGDPQPCPRCEPSSAESQAPEEDWKMGIQAGKFGPSVLNAKHKDSDPRMPCPLDEVPSDADAKAAGFADAKSWYAFSAGGSFANPVVCSHNLEAIAAPEAKEKEDSDGSAAAAYSMKKGMEPLINDSWCPEVPRATELMHSLTEPSSLVSPKKLKD